MKTYRVKVVAGRDDDVTITMEMTGRMFTAQTVFEAVQQAVGKLQAQRGGITEGDVQYSDPILAREITRRSIRIHGENSLMGSDFESWL